MEPVSGFLKTGMNVWAPAAKDNSGRAVAYLRPRNMDPKLFDSMKHYIHFSYFSTDILLDTE